MLTDGAALPAGSTLRGDVAIVGSGPAGILAAEELAGRGHSVVLLEAAGREHKLADSNDLRGQATGDPFPLVRARHRGFGGTSTHWTAETGLRTRALDAVDFESTSFRPGFSWPFGLETLRSYYARVHDALGSHDDYDPANLLSDAETAGFPAGDVELAMFRLIDHGVFWRRYDAVVANPRIQLVLHAPVREIEVSKPEGTVRRLVVATRAGDCFVEASAFVLAAGGLDNPRLLLASPGLTGAGVGNENYLVGRYFQDHLSVDVGVLTSARGGQPLTSCVERASDGTRAHAMLWLGDETIRSRGLPNAAFWAMQRDDMYLSEGVGALRTWLDSVRSGARRGWGKRLIDVVRGSPDIARYAAHRAARRAPSLSVMRIFTEQVPHADSRVRLASSRDRHGIPRIQLDWKVRDDDVAGIVAQCRALSESLTASGIGLHFEVAYDPDRHAAPLMTNYHHIGATRMAASSATGVVDPDCRVHSSRNLFVAGCSTFPTGGYVNPTLTLLALCLRICDVVSHELAPAAVDGG